MRPRTGLIAAALAATVLAVFLLPDENPGKATPSPSEAGPRMASGAASHAAGIRKAFSSDTGDLFASRNWRPQPPPVEASAAPVPQLPAMPYTYTGRMEDRGRTVLFLSRQQRVVLAREGETLDGTYRVDRITPWSVDFTYLPLKQKQSLNFAQ